MKKIIPVIVFLVTLIACQNNTGKNDKDPKVLQLEKKIKQLSAEKVIQQQEKITIKEETNDAKISQIEKLKATYNHVRAKFISTDEGDLFYYNFKDEKGIDYSFSYVKDESYKLLIDDTSSNFGLGINTKYKNKYFDIFYQAEKHDLLRWGFKQDYDVVIKMMLVEEINIIEDGLATKIPNSSISDSIFIILPTLYASEDLDSTIESKTWVGLFRNNKDNSVTCYKTKLKMKPIHSPVVDEEEEMSRIKIYCEGYNNDPMLLIAGVEIPENIQINSYKGLKNRLLPGESMQLGDNTIKASGTLDEYGRVKDYKMLITGIKNGMSIEQIFLKQDHFDDAMIQIIWTGDIDKDGFPDLYLDISYKYSFSNPALFLSSKAGDNELLKLVADIKLFGC
ncbi:MAG: hypothetical protein P8O09_07405 [Flavobacteriaceae bacterium]|nr:hypothetical protein [Flavobacteriaceae bacterium]